MAVRIGELLLKEKRITAVQLQEALTYQKTNGGKLGANLVKMSFVTDEEITALLSKQYGVPSIALNQFEIDPAVIKLVPAETARKYQVVPLSRAGATLTIAMADPTNVFAMDDVKFMTGYNVEPVVASETAVLDSIDKYYGAGTPAQTQSSRGGATASRLPEAAGESALDMATRSLTEMPTMPADVGGDVEVMADLEEISAEMLTRQGEEAPVIKLVNVILMSAISKGASDIHIEPYEKEYRVRYRMDGILYNVMAPPLKMRDAITSRVKIMARLDIAEDERIGALAEIDPLDVVGVGRHVPAEIVARNVEALRQPAKRKIIGLVVVLHRRCRVDVGHEACDFIGGVEPEVLDEIGGDGVDVHRHILQRLLGARGGEGVVGGPAGLALGGDDEGRELDCLVTGGSRRRHRRGRAGG